MWGASRFRESPEVGCMHEIFASKGRPCWLVFWFFWLGVYILVNGLEYVRTLSVPRGSRSGGSAPIFDQIYCRIEGLFHLSWRKVLRVRSLHLRMNAPSLLIELPPKIFCNLLILSSIGGSLCGTKPFGCISMTR